MEDQAWAPVRLEGDGPFEPDAFLAALAARRAARRAAEPSVDLRSLAIARRVAIKAIRAYRREVAPRLSRECVFDLTCSRYAELAIARNGVIRGSLETWQRLRRCRPENEAKIDYPRGVPNALPSDPDRQELQ